MACDRGLLIGSMQPFKSSDIDIETYLECTEQWFEWNDIDDSKKVSVLLTLIGMDTYVTLKNSLAPELPSSKSYMDIVKVLKNHYAPKKSIIAERFRFNKCLQESGETVAQFIIRLKQLSKDCQYGTFLDDALSKNQERP
ncbi:hypothetical protein QE152_g15339 [Popillia japonica]|uniref:Retrotransposon gag domain-containing protein n=1 Tax=Popillia japonica TaxID=7064 RepID=A0AAW1L8R2_POPJA